MAAVLEGEGARRTQGFLVQLTTEAQAPPRLAVDLPGRQGPFASDKMLV
jgi:hypothetical protein